MSTVHNVATSLTKVGLETLDVEEKPNQLRLICRLNRNFGEHWKLAMYQLLTKEQTAPWKVDISKKYFLRGNQVFYGWRLLFQVEEVSKHYDAIIRMIQSTPPPSNIHVEEGPLVGSAANRATRTNVGPVDKVMVGPMAAHNRRMGG